MHSESLYNAYIEIIKESDLARVIRVSPDKPKLKFIAGQYGSLGLISNTDQHKLIKRAYCLSSSMITLPEQKLIDQSDTSYYEFYFNKILTTHEKRESLTPKLFELKSGDRIFCGEKIVGYYTLADVRQNKNILLIASATGEAPNNSLVNQALLEKRNINICNIVIGPTHWASLYQEEHNGLMEKFNNYRFYCIEDAHYAEITNKISMCCKNPDYSESFLGFHLSPQTSHVFIAGDPSLIGAPKKKGAWASELPNHGLINILTNHQFSIRTKFSEGTIEYESYW